MGLFRRVALSMATSTMLMAGTSEVHALTREQECAAAAEALRANNRIDPRLGGSPYTSCAQLRSALLERIIPGPARMRLQNRAANAESSLSPQDVQPVTTNASGAQGSAAQTAPVASIEPTAMTGGVLAISGAASGPRLLTALSVNPFTLGTTGDVRSFAVRSRLADVSVVLPFNTSSTTGGMPTQTFDYVGLRIRVNLLASATGGELVSEIQRGLDALQGQVNGLDMALDAKLSTARDVSACADAILLLDNSRVTADCGGEPLPLVESEVDRRVREVFERARNRADRWYLGADLRADFGDPTQSNVSASRGTWLFAAVAGGVRFPLANSWRLGLLARGGLAYSSVSDDTRTGTAYDIGGAVELSTRSGTRVTNLGIGIEHRDQIGSSGVIPAGGTYTNLRIGFALPIQSTTGLSIGAVIPLHEGGGPPQITMSGDWSLLLPGASSR